MATYKVIQDIEAEDKLLGPLTLRQFIFAGITVIATYLSFLAITKGWWIVLLVMAPFILFGGFLAWPWSRDQPTEVWLLAKIRFMLKPRRRIWDQSGIKELVTITVPKKSDQQLSNNLSQTEVKSRLQALASTLDSRGWAIKNVAVNLYAQPAYAAGDNTQSDRLIDLSTIAREVPAIDIRSIDDMLDIQNNPTAQHLSQMMASNTQAHKQQLAQKIQQAAQNPATPPNYWFLHENTGAPVQPGYQTFHDSSVVAPGAPQYANNTYLDDAAPVLPDEQALLAKIHADKQKPDPTRYHMRVIKPPGEQKPPPPVTSVTAHSDPAILELANNNDLNVATVARQANKKRNPPAGGEPPQDEVVISLH